MVFWEGVVKSTMGSGVWLNSHPDLGQASYLGRSQFLYQFNKHNQNTIS